MDFLTLEPPSEFHEAFPKLATQVLVNPPGSGRARDDKSDALGRDDLIRDRYVLIKNVE